MPFVLYVTWALCHSGFCATGIWWGQLWFWRSQIGVWRRQFELATRIWWGLLELWKLWPTFNGDHGGSHEQGSGQGQSKCWSSTEEMSPGRRQTLKRGEYHMSFGRTSLGTTICSTSLWDRGMGISFAYMFPFVYILLVLALNLYIQAIRSYSILVTEMSPLGLILEDWAMSSHCSIPKKELVFYCNIAWPMYIWNMGKIAHECFLKFLLS